MIPVVASWICSVVGVHIMAKPFAWHDIYMTIRDMIFTWQYMTCLLLRWILGTSYKVYVISEKHVNSVRSEKNIKYPVRDEQYWLGWESISETSYWEYACKSFF